METEVLRKQNLNRKKNTENDNGNTRVVLLSRHLHGLAQSVKQSLTSDAVCTLVQAFVHSRLDYCVEFYLYPTVGTVLIHSIKPELTE